MEYLLMRPNLHRLLNNNIFDPLEFLLLGKGKAWGQIVSVGAQYIFPQFMPQGIGRSDTWVFGQLVHNLIHHSLQRGFEVAVLLLASSVPQALRQMLHELLHAVVDRSAAPHLFDQLLQHRTGIFIQCVAAFGLLLIELRQFLPEDVLRQTRFDLGDPSFREEALGRICTVTDHVDVRMVRLIVEGCVPSKLLPRDFHGCGHLHGIRGEKRLPVLRIVISQSGSILSPQGNDRRPHIAGIFCYRFCSL